MKKLFAMLFAAVVLMVSAPQADAAYHYMGEDGYHGQKVLLDDSVIQQLSYYKIIVHICFAKGGDSRTSEVYFHRTNGTWYFTYKGDTVDWPVSGCGWARNVKNWLINNGYAAN